MKLMITNGGPHPADKWADVSTDEILSLIQIDDDAATPTAAAARQAKRDMRPVLFDILMAQHDHVQKHERGECRKDRKRLHSALDPSHHIEDCAGSLDAALSATPFAEHFAKPEVRAVIHRIIGQHFADSMHIERRWAADKTSAKGT